MKNNKRPRRRNKYPVYERRKAEIESANLTHEEYERKIKALAKELRL